jgi:hypothetical protein
MRKNAYRIFVGYLKERDPTGRHMRRCGEYIKVSERMWNGIFWRWVGSSGRLV